MAVTISTLLKVTLKSHLPAPTELMGASGQDHGFMYVQFVLTCSSFTKGTSSLLHPSPSLWSLGFLKATLSTEDWGTSVFQPCPLSPRRPIFSLLLRCSWKPFLCFWPSSPDLILGFMTSSLHAQTVCQILSPCFHLLYDSFLCVSFGIHPGIFTQLIAHWSGLLWSLEGSSFNISQLSLFPLCSRMFRILASKHHQCQGWAQCTPPVLSHNMQGLSSAPVPCLLDLSFLESPYCCMAALQPCEPSHHSSVIPRL